MQTSWPMWERPSGGSEHRYPTRHIIVFTSPGTAQYMGTGELDSDCSAGDRNETHQNFRVTRTERLAANN